MTIPRARPAVIITGWRTGGTWLTHCLSNHPDIFCARAEALHSESLYRRWATPAQVLDFVYGQWHYTVNMCKLTYAQAFRDRPVWEYMTRLKPAVIHLVREDVVRQAVSMILLKMHNSGRTAQPAHSLAETTPARARLDPAMVVRYARNLTAADRSARERLAGWRVLELTYAEMVGGEGKSPEYMQKRAAERVCAFLGVPYVRMGSRLKAVNPFALGETVANWAEVRAALLASEFRELAGG
ncbi:MAG: hypothetical protein JW900_14275 [Anaerolineae bacterium]|nr:hypothetical protein [Anaerolineae bacterium]